MEPATLRIIDANFNRAREGLRVMEDYARFVLDDAMTNERIKHMRHGLCDAIRSFGVNALLTERDTPNDVGTSILTPSESMRPDLESVARASAARAAEALRCIEEYGKLISVEVSSRIEALRYELYSIEQEIFVTAPRRQKLQTARVHVLLTESLCRGTWQETALAAMTGGADVIQLREKHMGDAVLLQRAKSLQKITCDHNALLIVNDRPDIARLADADGVHLGQDDMSVAEARRIVGPTRLVGRSTHSRDEIKAALAEKPDYIGVGPMFASATKPETTVNGPQLLRLAAEMAMFDAQTREHCTPRPAIPLVAIGGISATNFVDLASSATAPFAIAVCQSVIASDDTASAVRELANAMKMTRPDDRRQAAHQNSTSV